MLDKGIICRVAPDAHLSRGWQDYSGFIINASVVQSMKALIIRIEVRDGIAIDDVDELVTAARGSQDAKEGIAARLENETKNFLVRRILVSLD